MNHIVVGIASPNPSYPQDVDVVTGTQEVKIGNKNLMYLGTQLNGYRDISTSKFNSASGAIGYYFKTSQLPDNVYVSTSNGNRVNASYYNEIPTAGSQSLDYSNSNVTESTLSINKNYPYVHIQLSYNIEDVNNIQIEAGTTKTDYITPASQTYTIHLGDIELYEDGYISEEEDKWYINNEYKKLTLNGTELWNKGSNTTNLFYYQLNDRLPEDVSTQNIWCNKLYWLDNYTSVANANQYMNTCQIATNNNGTSKNIFVKNDDYTSTSDFTNWLASITPIILYKSITPDKTEITNETLLTDLNNIKENAMSYSGTTNISTSGNLPVIITASALKQLS